jgi:hypothetical protein
MPILLVVEGQQKALMLSCVNIYLFLFYLMMLPIAQVTQQMVNNELKRHGRSGYGLIQDITPGFASRD